MPADSLTPPDGSPHQHHAHGSSDLWDYRFHQLEASNRRIESKVDSLVGEQGASRGRHDLLDQRVKTMEMAEASRNADARQMSLGVKLAFASAIISPFIAIAVVALKHTP